MNWCLSFAAPCAIAFALAGLAACKPSSSSGQAKPQPPAQVPKVAKEDDLVSVVLTPEAEKRLGVVTATVEMRKMNRNRTYGGDLIVPLGASTKSGGSPSADTGKPERSIYSLLPSLSPLELVRIAEMQVTADGQMEAARIQLEAAKVALARAETLFSRKAGSERAVDEAKAAVELAQAGLDAARARRELMGAPLFDAVARETLWLRVPVYVGDLQRLKTDAEVRVNQLAEAQGTQSRPGKPLNVPLSGAAAAATAELFYEVSNPEGKLRPGERVAVQIPLLEAEESLAVPWAAVLHDIHGGTWVYEQTTPQTYARRRVLVRYVDGAWAALATGPKAGTKVVTDGAAEIFGTEFGFGK